MSHHRSPSWPLYLIFFFSGMAAMIFETLWFRQAGLGLGNSVWATSLVLASFMAGLAIGNGLAARLGDRAANPIAVFAGLEVCIGLTGVALVFLLPEVGRLLQPWLGPAVDHPVLLNGIRASVSFLLLLVPATAMGMTLPLLTRALAAIEPRFGEVLGNLYGFNTLGAMAGVIATETLLVAGLGIRGSALLAGSIDGAVALAALGLSRRAQPLAPMIRPALPLRRVAPLLGVAFVGGFGTLALEVIWFRFLLLYVNGTAQTFAVMLAIVLGGIAGGGWLAARWLAHDPRAQRFAPVLLLASSFGCAMGYLASPLLVAMLPNGRAYAWDEVVRMGLPLMLPVALASGCFFTLVGTRLREEIGTDAASTGALTLANTVGAGLGSLAGGFVLLPWLGIEASFFTIGLLFALTGVGLAFSQSAPAKPVALAAGLAAVPLVFFPHGSMEDFHYEVQKIRHGGVIAETREGLTETIVYLRTSLEGQLLYHRMLTNGHSMSSSSAAGRRYMKLYTYLPAALHPELRRGLLISYGVGQTAKSLTDTKSFDELHFVDISRDVVELNRVVFPRQQDRPTEDPRVTVHIEDGRAFLQNTDLRFDLITGEPPPPGMAGIVNLYTREYFQQMHARLAPGGMVTYWLPLHSMTDRSAKAILRGFCDAFPDCSLWNGASADLMMLGTREATHRVSREHFEAQWSDPVVAPELHALGFEHPEQLGALFIGGSDWLRAETANTPPLLDDWPVRIVAPFEEVDPALRARYPKWEDTRPPAYRYTGGVSAPSPTYERWIDAGPEAEARFRDSPWIQKSWPASLLEATLPYFRFQRIVDDWGHQRTSGMDELHAVITASDLRAPVLWLAGSDSSYQRAASAIDSSTPEVWFHRGVGLLAAREFERAADAFARAYVDAEHGPRAVELGAYVQALSGHRERARALAERSDPGFQEWLEQTLLR
jgi:spermidine synthase